MARSVYKVPWLSPISGGGEVPGEQTGEGMVLSCLIGTKEDQEAKVWGVQIVRAS
jgi:hypothetical protein